MDPKDRAHIELVLRQMPLTRAQLTALVAEYTELRDTDREARFQANLRWLETQVA